MASSSATSQTSENPTLKDSKQIDIKEIPNTGKGDVPRKPLTLAEKQTSKDISPQYNPLAINNKSINNNLDGNIIHTANNRYYIEGVEYERLNNSSKSSKQNNKQSEKVSNKHSINHRSSVVTDDDEDDDEFVHEQYTFDFQFENNKLTLLSHGNEFDPLKLHDALFKFLQIVNPQTDDDNDIDRISLLFKTLSVLCDLYTQTSDVGDNYEEILSIDLVSDLVLALLWYTYEKYGPTKLTHFDFAMDLAKIVEKILILLNNYDENVLFSINNDEENWIDNLPKWLPHDTLSNINNMATSFHNLKLLYTIATVSCFLIYKLYQFTDNLSLNPFLNFFLKVWKCETRVVLLGLEIDRRDEELQFPGYPEVIRYIIKGASALRTIVAIILNNDVETRFHDLKHESLINFMNPWGRKAGTGALLADMRIYVASLLAFGSDLEEVTELLFNLEPDDRYDEDVKYMFELEYDADAMDDEYQYHHHIHSQNNHNPNGDEADERNGHLKSNKIEELDEDGNVRQANDKDLKESTEMNKPGLRGIRTKHKRMKNHSTEDEYHDNVKSQIQDDNRNGDSQNVVSTDGDSEEDDDDDENNEDEYSEYMDEYPLHPDCDCVFEEDEDDDQDSEFWEDEKIEENDSVAKITDAESKINKEVDGKKLLKANTHSGDNDTVNGNDLLAVRSSVTKAIQFDSQGKDWRDIPRGFNAVFTEKFYNFLKFSCKNPNLLCWSMKEIIEQLKRLVKGPVSPTDGEKILRSITWVIQLEFEEQFLLSSLPIEERLKFEEEKTKQSGSDQNNPDKIYEFMSTNGNFENMVKNNPTISFSIIDEMLMAHGYRRVLIWFLTHLELNQWLINYIHELLIGKRGNPISLDFSGLFEDSIEVLPPDETMYQFSREGRLELSNVEKSMLLHEFFSNAVIYLSRGTSFGPMDETDQQTAPSEELFNSYMLLSGYNYVVSRTTAKNLMKIICMMITSLQEKGIFEINDHEYKIEVQTLLVQWVGILPEARELFFKSNTTTTLGGWEKLSKDLEGLLTLPISFHADSIISESGSPTALEFFEIFFNFDNKLEDLYGSYTRLFGDGELNPKSYLNIIKVTRQFITSLEKSPEWEAIKKGARNQALLKKSLNFELSMISCNALIFASTGATDMNFNVHRKATMLMKVMVSVQSTIIKEYSLKKFYLEFCELNASLFSVPEYEAKRKAAETTLSMFNLEGNGLLRNFLPKFFETTVEYNANENAIVDLIKELESSLGRVKNDFIPFIEKELYKATDSEILKLERSIKKACGDMSKEVEALMSMIYVWRSYIVWHLLYIGKGGESFKNQTLVAVLRDFLKGMISDIDIVELTDKLTAESRGEEVRLVWIDGFKRIIEYECRIFAKANNSEKLLDDLSVGTVASQDINSTLEEDDTTNNADDVPDFSSIPNFSIDRLLDSNLMSDNTNAKLSKFLIEHPEADSNLLTKALKVSKNYFDDNQQLELFAKSLVKSNLHERIDDVLREFTLSPIANAFKALINSTKDEIQQHRLNQLMSMMYSCYLWSILKSLADEFMDADDVNRLRIYLIHDFLLSCLNKRLLARLFGAGALDNLSATKNDQKELCANTHYHPYLEDPTIDIPFKKRISKPLDVPGLDEDEFLKIVINGPNHYSALYHIIRSKIGIVDENILFLLKEQNFFYLGIVKEWAKSENDEEKKSELIEDAPLLSSYVVFQNLTNLYPNIPQIKDIEKIKNFLYSQLSDDVKDLAVVLGTTASNVPPKESHW